MVEKVIEGIMIAVLTFAVIAAIANPHLLVWYGGFIAFCILSQFFDDAFSLLWKIIKFLFWPALGIAIFWWWRHK